MQKDIGSDNIASHSEILTAEDNAIRFYSFGETAIVLEYCGNACGDQQQVLELVLQRQQRLLELKNVIQTNEVIPGIVDCIPGNQNLTVLFDPLTINANEICTVLNSRWRTLSTSHQHSDLQATQSSPIEVPVIYGGEYGPDLGAVANYHDTCENTVIEQHCAPVYTVLFNGFLPGFPYLTGLPKSLHTPRRTSPRLSVVAGSIAIGGSQTGIYPINSPGGWQIIGRCKLGKQKLFSPDLSPPQLFAAGCRIRFTPA